MFKGEGLGPGSGYSALSIDGETSSPQKQRLVDPRIQKKNTLAIAAKVFEIEVTLTPER